MARAPDYRIIGSGPVALACALFMVRSGIDPARLGLRLPPAGDVVPAPADRRELGEHSAARSGGIGPRPQRMLAISDGSRQLLSRVITMPAGGVIECIEVAMSGRSGRTRIHARDFGVAALGHVVAYPELVAALRTTVDKLVPAAAGGAFQAEASIASSGSDGEKVTIHADGLPRFADAPGIESRDFRQSALLTEVMAEHAGTTAYECFGRHGPLALLPSGPPHSARYAVVWCDEPARTMERAAMTPARLSAALAETLSDFDTPRTALGALQVCAPFEVASLSRLRRRDNAAGNQVWIGNAAQALHPVAGQGLNLGLRDAFELARSLADNEYSDRPLAPAILLARFAGERRLDRAVTTGVTDLLASAFGWPLARPLQSTLLTAMDLLPPLRRPLASTLLFGRR